MSKFKVGDRVISRVTGRFGTIVDYVVKDLTNNSLVNAVQFGYCVKFDDGVVLNMLGDSLVKEYR